jgi:hypothetical protein
MDAELEIQDTGYDTRDRLTLSEFGTENAGRDSDSVGPEISDFSASK